MNNTTTTATTYTREAHDATTGEMRTVTLVTVPATTITPGTKILIAGGADFATVTDTGPARHPMSPAGSVRLYITTAYGEEKSFIFQNVMIEA